MKSKYLTINDSDYYVDSDGNSYPDIFTFNINDIQITEAPLKYMLTERDIYRFDILIYNYYGTPDYDDIVLWYNAIPYIASKAPGDIIYLPTKKDIETFYRDNLV